MTAKPENLGHFIFNSDYPTDKIVWLYEGQFTTSSSVDSFYITTPDKLGTTTPVYCKGAVTIDDWQTSIMIGTDYSQAGKNASLSMSWSNYPQNRIGLHFNADFRSYPNRTAKYRIWAVQRDDIDYAIDYSKNTAAMKNKLVLDSDRNYPRLYMEGVAKSGETVKHNLGKIPYADYWYVSLTSNKDVLSRYWYYNPKGSLSASTGNFPTITATDKEISFRKVLNGNEEVDAVYYYRLYA